MNSAKADKRVILVICDGLGAQWIGEHRTPNLMRLRRTSRHADDHHAVFPSVTRVSSASIATGCHPARHGLEGNQMALLEDGRIVVHNVGHPEFIGTLRRVTGQTLRVPTLAQRLGSLGEQLAYSNVSAGAAYFLDPDHFGTIRHRLGSFARGGARLTGPEHLQVTHDLEGDLAMAERFGREVILGSRSPLAILWLSNPDLTTHYHPLGSQEHLHALRVTDAIVGQVEAQIRDSGQDRHTLFMVGSDHGHETVSRSVHLGEWLQAQGLVEHLVQGRIGVASQGTAALIYALEAVRPQLEDLLPRIAEQPWAGQIYKGEALAQLGLQPGPLLWAAIDTAQEEGTNAYGIRGSRWLVEDGEAHIDVGFGHHGGLGPGEGNPFLLLRHPDLPAGPIGRPTSLVDIAPTISAFLGMGSDGFDGAPLI